jgi:CcmD family protein
MRTIILTLLLLGNALLFAQNPQSEFVPVTEIPASEQLPSVPLVITAYAFVWLAFAVYAWMMWQKLGKVERELSTLSTQMSKPRTVRDAGGPRP